MQLTWRDYFTPFATMQVLKGNAREQREILLHNCQQRGRVAEVGHRWAQVAALCAVLGAWSYTHGVIVGAFLGVLGLVLVGPMAACMGAVWLVLYFMQLDLTK